MYFKIQVLSIEFSCENKIVWNIGKWHWTRKFSKKEYGCKWYITNYQTLHLDTNRGGEMSSVLASSAVDRGFEPRSAQTKDYTIGICCISAKHAALKSINKDWFARNQDNLSEWCDMSIRWLLFQWASTIKIQLSVLV